MGVQHVPPESGRTGIPGCGGLDQQVSSVAHSDPCFGWHIAYTPQLPPALRRATQVPLTLPDVPHTSQYSSAVQSSLLVQILSLSSIVSVSVFPQVASVTSELLASKNRALHGSVSQGSHRHSASGEFGHDVTVQGSAKHATGAVHATTQPVALSLTAHGADGLLPQLTAEAHAVSLLP